MKRLNSLAATRRASLPASAFALVVAIIGGGLLSAASPSVAAEPTPYPGTEPLKMEGDIAATLVEGVDRFLLREIERSVQRRAAHWKRDLSSPEAHAASVEPNRKRLAHILGVRDARVPMESPQLVGTTNRPALIGKGNGFQVYQARWPALRDIHGEGLLLIPDGDRGSLVNVVVIPDADQTPEMLVGLAPGLPLERQIARHLGESGCRVLVPVLIDRHMEKREGRANLTSREFLYRSAYELGRHLIGYELQKILAGVDWFSADATQRGGKSDPTIGVFGYGEGGMLALYAGALDPRIDAVGVSGFFGPREGIWDEPIDRNVFALLEMFGGAELATLVAPRPLIIEASKAPELELPSDGGAPARLATPDIVQVRAEVARANSLLGGKFKSIELVEPAGGESGSDAALTAFLARLPGKPKLAAKSSPVAATPTGATFDPKPRQLRQMHEIDEHNQWLLRESPYVRTAAMNIGLESDNHPEGANKLDTSSPENYVKSVERFREFFRHEVVGHFDEPRLPPQPRSRKAYDTEKWVGYEVVLDVFPDVIAYGILCVPKDVKPNERRPVVVCQHGLEGRPQDVVTGDNPAYHDFAAKLAERGFITFAPQNLYIFRDKFRTLQRKAYPLKKTLFSVIVPQHQQIVDWLKTLPIVDPERIAFYGLSYGGKSAMRIPPLVTDYCLSICSADFNEWVWKNASSRARYSYVWTGEYEIFEFDLGSTFNYAEMAALIAPRPFMVERGHFDGVAPDETVGHEFAKVRHLYAARLKLPERCEIEWFVGPHTINGKGTFEFLHRHLKWR